MKKVFNELVSDNLLLFLGIGIGISFSSLSLSEEDEDELEFVIEIFLDWFELLFPIELGFVFEKAVVNWSNSWNAKIELWIRKWWVRN